MGLLLLGLGGALGSITRFQLGVLIAQRTKTTFPVGTFLINVTGAFLLGIVSGINVGGNWYLLLADGFLGAYTTFSTFMFEGVLLFGESKKINAYCYILGSLALGIGGFAAGFALGRCV